MKLFQKIQRLFSTSSQQSGGSDNTLTERQLIECESEIGRNLFGPIPEGHQREFFCLDQSTWIWYEQWQDADQRTISQTIRYEISPAGILKVKENNRYSYIDGQELENFTLAIKLYYERVARSIYHRDPYTGKFLSSTS